MKHPEWANPEVGKSRDKSGCSGSERRGNGERQLNGYVVSFSDDGSYLELDSGDGCTTF